MVSESPARSSHRPPQPTILRLVCRLWSTLCRFIRQVFRDEIDPPEGFRPQGSDLMPKPLIVAGCDLGVIDEDRTRCLQDRERNGKFALPTSNPSLDMVHMVAAAVACCISAMLWNSPSIRFFRMDSVQLRISPSASPHGWPTRGLADGNGKCNCVYGMHPHLLEDTDGVSK